MYISTCRLGSFKCYSNHSLLGKLDLSGWVQPNGELYYELAVFRPD